ncbi:MAG: four helix bundle protein [Gemmatimonadales bacterium]
MGSYKKLEVWQRAHRLAIAAYNATRGFPKSEQYGLTSQIRRAAASIPANVAEGCGRLGDREMVRFLQYALGSANELEYHLLLARELGFLSLEASTSLTPEAERIQRMLAALIRSLRTGPIDQGPTTNSQRRRDDIKFPP